MSLSLPWFNRSSFRAVVRSILLFATLGLCLPALAVDLLVANFTDTPDPAVRGGQIVYRASITNNEADTAHDAVLTFTLDAQTTFVSVSDTAHCTYNSGTHTVGCQYATVKGDLSGPGSADDFVVDVTVSAKPTAGATVSAGAAVTGAEVDTNPANNHLSQLTTLDNGADMAMALVASPASVPASGVVTYTATATNNGPNAAGTVSVALTLSPNLTYQSASGSGWSCSRSGQVVTCTRASAPLGALPAISVNAKASGASTGTITSAATVSVGSGATDYNPANDSTTANVTITTGTDLAITKTASSGTPASGAPMTFTLAPRNNGPFAATSVTVSDTLPAGFTAISAAGTGWSCGVAGQTVTCTTASYAVGATNNITVTATTPVVTGGTPFSNTATIASATPDPTPANDSSTASFTVLPAGVDLSITKTKSPNPVAQGSNITNTIKVTNQGPQGAAAGEVQVTDTLQAGESYVSYSGTNWTCGAAGSVVTCTYNAALANGAGTSNLQIVTRADNAGTLTNNACAAYTDTGGHGYVDPVGGNNCAAASVVSTASAGSIDLQLAKAVSVDPLVWNATSLDYTLTVTNTGPGDATGVKLTDAIPGATSGTGVVAARTGGTSTATFSCTNGSTVTCTQTGGTIAAGTTAVFTITVSRPLLDSASQPGGKWTNTASVTSTDQGDTDLTNNSASIQVKVDPVADVKVSATVTPSSAQAGTEAVYVLTVNNNGPSTARGVTLADVFTVPSGTMTFLSATPSTGSCAAFDTVGKTLNCSLGDMASGSTATVTVKMRPDYMALPPSPRTLTSDVTVATTTQESDTTNNTAQAVLTVTQASVDLLVNNTDSPDPLGYVPAGAGPVFPDNVVTYRNTVTNHGPSVASGLVLTYTMTPPAGKQMTFLGDKLGATGQSYSNYCNNLNSQVTGPSTLTITCTLPASFILAANNATTDLYLDFRADSTPTGSGDTYASTVTIASNEPDSLAANNTVGQTTTVRNRADLQLAKSARAWIGGADTGTAAVQLRQPFYWVLTLTNAGPGDSASTTISDVLPSGVVLYTPGASAPAQYKAAPYNGGVTWSTNNAAPTSGACSVAGSSITCNVGLLASGKVAVVKIPVVSATTGTRNNCASATTSEVDPNGTNNTGICSSVTVQASSLAGTVYADANANGAKDGAEAGIGGVAVTLAGTDDYGNAVSLPTATSGTGDFSFTNLSPGTYALSETQPSGYQDGVDTAGTGGGTAAAIPADSITGIALAGNTNATGYLFGEVADAALSGYVFVDTNTNALRDAGETTGIAGVTVTLTGTDDRGAVSRTTTTGAAGTYSFTGLRPGTYTVTETPVPGVTHTGMTVGSAGGKDGAASVGAGSAIVGAGKNAVGGIVLVAGTNAQNYNFGESGQGLSGRVYADLNQNGTYDAGEPGIPGVSVTLSGNTASGTSVCAAISPNPCTVTTGSDGLYSFSGVPASDATGYRITEQAQASAPLSNYGDGAEHVGSLGGNAAVNDQFGGIVVAVGQFGSGYDFGERGGSIAARVYQDKNGNGTLDTGETGIPGVTVTLSGTTANGTNVCTILPSCTATTAADGTVVFKGLPASGNSGYTLVETQPADYAEGTNTPGTSGGTVSSATGTSTVSGIVLASGVDATGYLFGEKTATLSGAVYADTNNNGVRDAGENGIAGVTLTLSGHTASGADVCTAVASCTTVTAADGSYAFAGLPASNTAGYAVTEQAQATAPLDGYLDGKLTSGTNCGSCTQATASPNAFAAVQVDATKTYTGYNFAELPPASVAGHVYKDVNANGTLDNGEALAGVTLALSGNDDLGQAVTATVVTGADGSYRFANLRPSGAAGYTVTETQPASLADFAAATGTAVGKVGGTDTGTAALNSVSAIVLPAGQSGTGYDFREKTASLAGKVFLDTNNNGNADAGEQAIDKVTVRLTGTDADGAAVDLTTTTAADGTYAFTGLKSGTYVLTETQPTAYLDGKEHVGSAGGTVNNARFDTSAAANAISAINLAAGTDGTGYDFGEQPLPTSGGIEGTVFVDLDDDGRQGAGETGIAGVVVRLSGTTARGAAVTRETTTGADGHYRFTGLEGSDTAGYSVTEVQPASHADGKSTPGKGPGKAGSAKPVPSGGNDVIAGIVLGEDVQLAGYDFGERSQASLAGVVYVDQDASGAQDAGEPGLPGVTLTLQGKDAAGNAVRLTTVSGADGGFVFPDVPASDKAGYTLTETQPQGYRDGNTAVDTGNPGRPAGAKPVAGGQGDAIDGIVFTGGSRLTGYRFGEYGNGARLSGRVYADANNDGIAQDGEAGIAGVTVQLTGTDRDGHPVARTATTGADGHYVFDALPPSGTGGYRVTETQPAGYNDGKTTIAAGNPGAADGRKPVGVGNQDAIGGITLADRDLAGYDFGELLVPSLKPPIVNGYVWLDRAHTRQRPNDGSQQGLANWTVQLRQNGNLVCTVQTSADGFYQFDNLHCPGYETTGLPTGSGYSIVFSKEGNRMPAVAVSGGNAGTAAPTGGQIDNVTLRASAMVVEQNLPLDPAGVVYDAQTRKPVAGAVVTITGPAGFDPTRHLVGGVAAQAQTVGADGMYQFLLQNDFPSGVYTLAVTAPAGYLPAPSQAIAPCSGVLTVGLQPNPALVQASDDAPGATVALHNAAACAGLVAGGARTTQYYQSFAIRNGGSAPILNNHLPLDPVGMDGLVLTKTTPLVNVARGDLVPYTITATNTRAVPLPAARVDDMLPPGFQYRSGSARVNGAAAEPKAAGRTLSFAARTFAPHEKVTYSLVLVVGAGVGEGEYVNRAVAVSPVGGQPVSNTASAAVRVTPDATFDCPDVIGKVFDDANVNGYQDDGERGIPGVRLATPRGLLVTTDAEGRYHVPCADIPNADRGANFVMKLDDRTLPSGYRVTTENPGSVRVTRGKVAKLNFGAAIHRVVLLEMSDAAFAAGGNDLLPQWNQQLDTMIEKLNEQPSVVRIVYRNAGGDAQLATRRLDAVRAAVRERWRRHGERYPLAVEVEGMQ